MPPHKVHIRSAEVPSSSVSAKIEEGDFQGAVRLASSSDTFAPIDDHTLEILREKHSPPHPASNIPPFQSQEEDLIISSSVVRKAIYSFPAGSAGGPDGLRPQHLKNILVNAGDELESEIMHSVTTFVNLVSRGEVLPSACPFFFGT